MKNIFKSLGGILGGASIKKLTLRLLKPLIIRLIIKQLENPKTQRELVDLVNKKIDIPKLKEQEEHVLFDGLYETLKEGVILLVSRV